MKTKNKFSAALILLCLVLSCSATVTYKTGSYPNIQRIILYNASSDRLQNPMHQMSEGITFDQSKITTGSSGVSLQSGAVAYNTILGYIPSEKLLNTSGYYIDYAYRGKIILFGEEYYVQDIDPPDFISACKGEIVDNVSNLMFSNGPDGYEFRVDSLYLECHDEACSKAGYNLSVRKPNGTIVSNVTATYKTNPVVDNLEISLISDPGDLQNASLIVYDMSTEAVLQNGYTLEMAGALKPGWLVSIAAVKQPFDAGMDISEYSNIDTDQYLFANATIRYTTPVTLNMSRYLDLPALYRIRSNGTSLYVSDQNSTTTTTSTTTSTTTTTLACTLVGDTPPCGQISLSEVINLINRWASGTANLTDVIALINAWAATA